MRIAIAGGTGTIGQHIVAEVRARGDEPVVLARSQGVDVLTGEGLDAALDGVDAVVDALNITTLKGSVATEFFEAATGNLFAAARRRDVRNAVIVSIVGIDRMPYEYYAGKLAQERVATASEVPWTILRATQFHDFARQILARASFGPLRVAPRARVQPVATREVAARVAELAAAPAVGRAPDYAGPREEQLDKMVRTYARRVGIRGSIPSVNIPGKQQRAMREGLGLPGPDAVLGTQTFAEWLAAVPLPPAR